MKVMCELNPDEVKRYVDDVAEGRITPKAGQTYVEAWLEKEGKLNKRLIDDFNN